MSGSRQPGGNRELVVTTGTTLTIAAGDAGKTFSNVGAGGNIAYTVGAAATFRPGDDILILSSAAGTVTVNFTAGELIAFNDSGANSIALSQASEIIGGGFWFICLSDTKWHCLPLLYTDVGGATQTTAITT